MAEVCFSKFHAFDKVVDLPEAAEVVVGRLDALDVHELIKFIVFPKGTGEGCRADEKTPLESQHRGDIGELLLDAFAGGPTVVQGAPEFDDEAGALAEFGRVERHGFD
jgi:hypothetical protein